MTRYVFVTGGVVSSLGKGVLTACLGSLLEARGLTINVLKMDPYINVDPGTMSPYQHGEVFVTIDGAETDLDLGHYERFTHVRMSKRNNFTAGGVYEEVIRRERAGGYLGGTVQIVPHITDEIRRRIELAGEGADVLIAEIGGTVGDIEAQPFFEAIRQMRLDLGVSGVVFVHLTLVPYLSAAGEMKTKPTQHATRALLAVGIQPDVLVCRSEAEALSEEDRAKIANFTNVARNAVVSVPNVDTIYRIPDLLCREGLDARVLEKFGMACPDPDLSDWDAIIRAVREPSQSTRIAMVGKYVSMRDAYKSLIEALRHAGIHADAHVEIERIDAEDVERHGTDLLKGMDGILVPGGFGGRGFLGKVLTSRFARETGTPYLGICYGLHAAVIDVARHAAGLDDAHSTEIDPGTKTPVISLVSEWRDHNGEIEKRSGSEDMGGTMRLGEQPCILRTGTKAHETYGTCRIVERHRHRYEVHNGYVASLEKAGLVVAGRSDNGLVEVVEVAGHPWFVACQFHPEFASTPRTSHPLFDGFIGAALKQHAHDASVVAA